MEDDKIKAQMDALKVKSNPTNLEVQKYIRYLVNVMKYDAETIYDNVPHWKKEDIDKALKEVERENLKPKPQRYYVSLKEPLEGDY